MTELNLKEIEKKWQDKWLSEGINKATQEKGKKFFMHFAYPGVSGFLHVGHMRGFTYTDVVTRYKRMTGHDVFFPVGTHPSGNQVISFAQKIKNKDEKLVNQFLENNCPKEVIETLTTPEKIIDYFNEIYQSNWKDFGFLADYEAFTSTNRADYNKFIEWQFKKLKDLNLLVQKPYFADFCPTHGPVSVDPSETDLSKGGNAEKHEYTLLKLKLKENKNTFLIAATLRPETVYGQTNVWVNPENEHVKIKVGAEKWIVSKEASEKLKHQLIDEVKILNEFNIKEIIGERVIAPGPDREVPILPASFCDANVGTGIVTSVPSSAIYDYVALRELKNNDALLNEYSLTQTVNEIELIPIIKTELGDAPGKTLSEELNITSTEDDKIEEATKNLYSTEFHTGILLETCGSYTGLKVREAKEKVKQDLISAGKAGKMYDLSEEVICRCGERVFVKRVDDQWFIKYSDEELTEKSKKHAETMNVYPEEYKKNLQGVLDWFGERPSTRLGNWIGTKLPFDDKWTIEPIADSTLYPAYYVIARHVNSGKLKVEDLTEAFFDYVLLGKGKGKPEWTEYKKEFDYWYPTDINLGGKEHRTVHFPPYIMNHVAILPRDKWPLGIFVNYWVTGKEGKLSKSKGGAEPITKVIEKYSADALRLYYCNIGSPHKDVEWSEEEINRYKAQIERVFTLILESEDCEDTDLTKWLESEFHKSLKQASNAWKDYDFRTYSETMFFELFNKFKWFKKRAGKTPKRLALEWLKTLSPITPHLSEEAWHKLGNNTLISIESWPELIEGNINEKLGLKEKALEKVLSDVHQIKKITGIQKPSKVTLFIIPVDEYFIDAKDFLEKELGCSIEVLKVNETSNEKARKAKPGKPAILLE